MKEIPLTQGKVALVDDEDFDRLSQYKWYAQKDRNTFYAHRRERKTRKIIRMHREIFDLNDAEIVDHKDRNGLNNTKENLRRSSYTLNQFNKKVSSDNKLGIRGVSLSKYNKFSKYRVHARLDGKQVYIGAFKSKEAAEEVYKSVIGHFYGEDIMETL